MVDEFTLFEALIYSFFEVGVLATEFYTNLLILIPVFLRKDNQITYSLSLILLLVLGFFFYVVIGFDTMLLGENMSRATMSFALNHGFFLFISFMIWYSKKYFEERHKSTSLEKEKLKLELELLKSQISPHFLFNTLNNIYSLSIVQHENTPKMIAATSEILRYYSNNGGLKFVNLVDEINMIEEYIRIQDMRNLPGSHKLSFTSKNISDGLKVPPFILLTMVENAFKHGNVSVNSEGFVNIYVSIKDNEVTFQVENSYADNKVKNGIGLENLSNQLELIFEKKSTYVITNSEAYYKIKIVFDGSK